MTELDPEQAIVAAVSRCVPDAAIILVGSRANGTAVPSSDYDVVVGVSRARLPFAVRPLARAASVLERTLGVPVSINPVPLATLQRPPRNLFLWKLQREGRVLAGDLALADPGSLQLTPAMRRSYALSAVMFLLEGGDRAEEKAEAHRAFLGGGDLLEEASLPVAPESLGNLLYALLSALRGRNRLWAIAAPRSVERRLAAVAVGLLRSPSAAELESLRRILPRPLAPRAGASWDALRDVVVHEWPAAHPVLVR